MKLKVIKAPPPLTELSDPSDGIYILAFPCGARVISMSDMQWIDVTEEKDCPVHREIGNTVKFSTVVGG